MKRRCVPIPIACHLSWAICTGSVKLTLCHLSNLGYFIVAERHSKVANVSICFGYLDNSISSLFMRFDRCSSHNQHWWSGALGCSTGKEQTGGHLGMRGSSLYNGVTLISACKVTSACQEVLCQAFKPEKEKRIWFVYALPILPPPSWFQSATSLLSTSQCTVCRYLPALSGMPAGSFSFCQRCLLSGCWNTLHRMFMTTYAVQWLLHQHK